MDLVIKNVEVQNGRVQNAWLHWNPHRWWGLGSPIPPHPPKREDGLRAYPSSEENETILPLVTFNTNDKNGALQFLTFFKYLLNFLTFTRDMGLQETTWVKV